MLVRDESLLELPEASAAYIANLAEVQALHSQMLAGLASAIPASEGTHKCPRFGCQRWLTPVDGRWPGHDMAAGPAGRRNGPFCPMSGQPVDQLAVTA